MPNSNRSSGRAQEPSSEGPFITHPGDVRTQAQEEDTPETAIAVMGATGSGKSTFINLVSGSNLGVSAGLRSCTEAVHIAGAFYLDGRRVVLIDTPGFDDTARSDTDVLKMIAVFLATSYSRGYSLVGVLYFHRISDPKMGGVSTRNFSMFRKLCGDSTLRNVVIVTNRWGEVDPRLAEAREAELAREDIFFKPVLDKGGRMARHDNTVPSAENIIRLILENHPLPLRIQEELVDEHKDISETGAGEELNRALNAQIKRHQQEMRKFREEMQQAMKDKDGETKRELEIEVQRMRGEMVRLKKDIRRLESEYKEEKERLEERLEQIGSEARREERLEQIGSKARREADRVAAQYQQQINELRNTMRSNTMTPAQRKEVQLRGLTNGLPKGPAGFFSRIGLILDRLL